jgi:cell division protein FtsW (lipid II flippase)
VSDRSGSKRAIDWVLISAIIPILGAGLVTMNAFSGKSSFMIHQLIWIAVSFTIFFVLSYVDFRFLRRTGVLVRELKAGSGSAFSL